jgi:hypothetical protein
VHSDDESRKKHELMDFYEGWAKALEQLVEHMKKVRAQPHGGVT